MSIEAMLSILAFFCILGLFLDIAIEQSQQAGKAVNDFKALAEARKCALIIDAVFANSGGFPEETKINCFQEKKNFVSAKFENAKASAAIIAPEVFLNQQGALTMLEVKTNAHYK